MARSINVVSDGVVHQGRWLRLSCKEVESGSRLRLVGQEISVMANGKRADGILAQAQAAKGVNKQHSCHE